MENDWNFWLYPAQIEASPPADVLVTSDWAEAEARLAAGGKVLFTPGATGLVLRFLDQEYRYLGEPDASIAYTPLRRENPIPLATSLANARSSRL